MPTFKEFDKKEMESNSITNQEGILMDYSRKDLCIASDVN